MPSTFIAAGWSCIPSRWLEIQGFREVQTQQTPVFYPQETPKNRYFFRDHHPFEDLRKVVIPDLIERRRNERRLSIWSAACSTGQEPYSVAMLLREHFPELSGWKVSILASDISRDVLERARIGRYTHLEANRGLPARLLVKYFEQHGTEWQLLPEICSMVDFQEFNLVQAWPPLARVDLVLLRNVMIYFAVETKKRILSKIAGILGPNSYLLLGGAETTFNLDDSYRRVESLKTAFFQLASELSSLAHSQ